MKKGFYYIAAVFLVALLWSCSTKKNTRMNRFYHSLNSRYNIYYNGKLSFDEALLSMQKGYKENYSDMILMYPVSAQPKDKKETGGPFDRAIEKSNKAIKLHSIKAKPKKKAGWRNDPKQVKLQAQEEYNPFLKHCWMLMGEAQFYNADFLQASATFSYIARHYKVDEEMVAAAKIWQARCYAEMGWIYEAEDILNKLNANGIPKKNIKQYEAVYADYLIKNQQFEDAIPYLKSAIKSEKNRLQKSRMKYLLGQIYASLEMDGMAYKAYGEVIRSNPPYELEFAARIRQTEVLVTTDYQKVVKKLERMAKSQKNKELLDQVYYALGNVYMSREDTVNAIKNYELGVEKSVKNGLDKALCQIRLGDLYFEKADYVKAQPNFSGALAGIQKEYKDYERIAKLSAVLDELVVHVEAVHLQDSLQTLAKMPESERLAVIDKIIEKVKEEEEKAKAEAEKEAFLADQESRGSGIDRPGTQAKAITLPTATGEAAFYFYNPQAVSQGKTQFQRKWGRRPLEDNWRRRNKKMSTFDDPADTEAEENGQNAAPENQQNMADNAQRDTQASEGGEGDTQAPGADDPKSREYYLQQLPLTPEDVEASNVIIVDGLYNMAMIYKDKLGDLPLSIKEFKNLETRFPDNIHLMESYYQIYLMALRLKDVGLSEEYKRKMMEKFPDSDYAVAIADPNYERNIRMMDVVQDSIYEQTYERYLAEDTTAVRRNYKEVSEKYPLAKLLPKFMFLEALTYVQAGDAEGFKQALKALLDKYPSEDVSELAGEMLKGVLRGRQMVRGGVTGMTWNLRFGAGEDGSLSAADSARVFKAEPNTPYRMIMIYPTGAVDRNQLLYTVAAYNFANFMVKQLDMAFEESGIASIFTLTGFYNFDEAWHYYKMIYDKSGYASALGNSVDIIPISEDNYETLMHGKTLDEYIAFFDENFHDKAPELMAKWNARKDEQQKEIEKADSVLLAEPKVDSIVPAEKVPEKETIVEKKTEEKVPEMNLEQKVDRKIDSVTVKGDSIILKQELPVIPVDSVKIAPVDTIQPEIKEQPVLKKEKVIQAPPKPEKDKGLTLKDIEEIRKLQAEAEELRKEEARRAFQAEQEAEQVELNMNSEIRSNIESQQKAEEESLMKAKAEREHKLEMSRKERLKQAEKDRKAKMKAKAELRKEKEKAYKERLKLKEKQRKEKERTYKQKLKEREKARKAELKAREEARKNKGKARR